MENLSSCARTMAGLFERLRCRIVDNRWVEAEEFKVSEHLFEMTVSPPETITSVLGDFVSEMLPEDRPLWHMTLVHDTLAKRDMVIFRSHHAVGDGLSLVQTMNWIFDIQIHSWHKRPRDLLPELSPGGEVGGGDVARARDVDGDARRKHARVARQVLGMHVLG